MISLATEMSPGVFYSIIALIIYITFREIRFWTLLHGKQHKGGKDNGKI